MRIRSPKDFWSGLFFIAVAVGFIVLSRQYNMGNMHRMGPALFPTLVGMLLAGLGVALTWQNAVDCFMGCFLGTLVGVLPGIGPVATVAMLLPFTFGLGPAPALIMLAGIYYGAQYGGSPPAPLG